MPALPPYIPAKDAAFGNWIDNFSALITAAPATYGLLASDATAIASVTAIWDAAYALVTSPMTKTPNTVQAKDTARITALATVRPYAQTIALNAGVNSADKIALGINPRQSVPLPITAPTTYPSLTIPQALSLQHVIRFRDSLASPSVKAKPYGVLQMYLYGSASATVITDPTALKFLGGYTKSPSLATWPSQDAGQVAYYAARWATRKGLLGPWSPIVSMTIAQ